MQSFFAFCSLCLQFSNLATVNTEILTKRDEACTLCLVDMFQPTKIDNFTSYNRSSSEIINDGLYFNNPLLQEALKLKMEQQFLVQTDSSVEMNPEPIQNAEPSIKVTTQSEAEEALNILVQRLQGLALDKKYILKILEDQKNSVTSRVQERVRFVRKILDQANWETENKLKLPQNLQKLYPLLDSYAAEILDKVLPEQFERKSNGFSGKVLKKIQEFSKELQKLNSNISQAQSPQDLDAIIQEIHLVHNQTLNDLEQQYTREYMLDEDSIIGDLIPKTDGIIKQVSTYLKPIKTTLKAGEKLTAGQRISSENGFFHLVTLGEGGLALYKDNSVIWRTDRFSTPSLVHAFILLDPKDGLLKIRDPYTDFSKSLTLKNSDYKGNGEAYLTVTNAGEVKIIESGVELWSPLYIFPERKVLAFRDNLSRQQFIVSENEKYTLQVSDDCYLILYNGSFPIWNRWLVFRESERYCFVSLDRDGKLKAGQDGGKIVLDTDKPLKGTPSLIVRNDGVLAIMDGDQEIYTTK